MSSGAASLNRKRTHSLEQGGEPPGSDINTKKPRISSEAPSNRSERKRRRRRRIAPGVEDAAGSSSTRSHNDGAEPMSPGVQHRGSHRGKPRRVVESDEEDGYIAPWQTPHSQVAQKSQMNTASTSSSPSLKGKEREAEPVSVVSTSNTEDPSKAKDLNQKLDALTTELGHQSALISAFKDSLTCQICVDLMHKPFTLAPCGHIACYGCLVGWFKSNVGEDELGPQSVHRKKTCPHCRSVVRDRPIENFTIKEMVNSLVSSGLVGEVPGGTTDAAPATSTDPWAGIFPKHPVMENNYDGLPFPLWDEGEDEDYGYEEGDMGIHDEEDDVYRCRGCMNEVVDGFCTVCERQYQPTWAGPLLGGLFGGYGDRLWGDDDDSDSDEEEEDFREDYEGSFIDDDEQVVGDPELVNDVATPPSHHEDEEGDDDIIEVDSPAVVRQRSRLAPIVISSDEEDDEYTDANALGDYGRFWNEEEDEDGDYHDAHSDSGDHGHNEYWSDGELHDDDDHHSFYDYL